MKIKICFILLITIALIKPAFSQDTDDKGIQSNVTIIGPGGFSLPFKIAGNNTEGPSLRGLPFIHKKWEKGRLLLKDKNITGIGVRYNAYYDRIELLKGNKAYSIFEQDKVKRIELLNKDSLINQIFIYTAHINTNGEKESGYFQLLIDGEISLLKRYTCKIKKPNFSYSMRSGHRNPRYVHTEKYYIKKSKDSIAKPIEMKWDEFFAYFGSKAKKMKDYARKIDLSPANEKDLMLILRYANTIN